MSDVVFRRINGRIVPIRKGGVAKSPKESRKVKATKAVAAVTTGTAVGYYSGGFAAAATRVAANMMNNQYNKDLRTKKAIKMATARAARKAIKAGAVEQGSLGFMASQTKMKFKPDLDRSILESARVHRQANRLFKGRLAIRSIGASVAGGLIGYGAVKGIEAISGKDASKGNIAKAFEVATPIAAGLVTAAYYSRFVGLRSGVKLAIKAYKKSRL